MVITANGIRMNYEISGKEGAPIVVLSHSLGSSLVMWGPQMESLRTHFQVLRYDTRGHGGTESPGGSYTLEMLGEDAIALLDALKIPAGPLRGAFPGRDDRAVFGAESPGPSAEPGALQHGRGPSAGSPAFVGRADRNGAHQRPAGSGGGDPGKVVYFRLSPEESAHARDHPEAIFGNLSGGIHRVL